MSGYMVRNIHTYIHITSFSRELIGIPVFSFYIHCVCRCTFVDFVSGTLASTRSIEDCAAVLSRYREAFAALVGEILKKLQFRCNSTALEEMDDETIGKRNVMIWFIQRNK